MKRKSLTFAIAAAACCVLIITSGASAGGDRANVIGISMGRVFAGSARGVEAVGTNPADLVLPHRGKGVDYIEEIDSSLVDSTGRPIAYTKRYTAVRETPPGLTLSIIPFGLSIRSDFINYDIYKSYLIGDDSAGTRVSHYITTDDKNSILDKFPNGIAETYAEFDIRLFGMTIHNDWLGDIAFTITDRASLNLDVPKDYARFALFGLDSLGSTYDLAGTNIRGWYLRDFAVSYARKFPQVKFVDDFSAGITIKMVHGYAVALTDQYSGTFGNTLDPVSGYHLTGQFNTRMIRSSIDEINNGKDSSQTVSPFPNPAGKGLGFDLGVSGELRKGIRAGISITDIGSITWTRNTKENLASANLDLTNPTSQEQTDSLKNAFEGTENPIGEFSTSLPTVLRIGAAFQLDNIGWVHLPGQQLVMVDYEQGFNSMPGNCTRPRLAVGTEWRLISILPFRTGISMGGADRFNWAAGFGLDLNAFNLNIGTENIDLLFSPNAFNQASIGMEMLLRL